MFINLELIIKNKFSDKKHITFMNLVLLNKIITINILLLI